MIVSRLRAWAINRGETDKIREKRPEKQKETITKGALESLA